MLRNTFTAALLAVMLVVLVAGNMQAQTLASKTVTATANVLSALSLAETDVAFGNVARNVTAVIDPVGTANQYVGSGATFGTATVTGEASTTVIVSWPATITLNQDNAPHTAFMTLTLAVSVNNANNRGASTVRSPGWAQSTDGSGNLYLWIGGSMPVAVGQTTDSYTGTGNFTVEYQ